MPPEVEIALHRRDETSYAVELRLRGEEDDRRAEEYPVRFEFARLAELAGQPKDYGELLTSNLFKGEVEKLWTEALQGVKELPDEGGGQPLRLRLWIDRWSFPLHHLRWETLRDPVSGRSLVTDMKVWFSRHLSGPEKRPVHLRLKRTKLRALVAAANPPGLETEFPNLAPIDTATVLRQAEQTIGHVEKFTPLSQVTLKDLGDRLRADEYDLLYLVCHGAINTFGDPFLLLLDDDRKSTRSVFGADLVAMLTGLLYVPRLIVLASCQSAGRARVVRGPEDASLVALGPLLAEAGTPAVIAMHGNVTQDTADQFTRAFFATLFADGSAGNIDRAMTEARNAIVDRDDAWAPVLYSRLVESRLWNEGAFTSRDPQFNWGAVIDNIRGNLCVPILGSGLLEHVVGSPQELAYRWAKSARYPLARQDFNDLTRVAQFLETSKGGPLLRKNYVQELINGVTRLWPALLKDEPGQKAGEKPEKYLLRLFTRVWPLLKQHYPAEPHRVLARLGCDLYITTNPDTLLTLALKDEKIGDQAIIPREALCPWRQGSDPHESDDNPFENLSAPAPLVYKMFGSLDDLSSLVLTEDDYLSYLMGVAGLNSQGGADSKKQPQAYSLAATLMQRGLLFLGFRLEDWDFRLFHHFLMSRRAWQSRKNFNVIDVAVQLNPDDTFIDPSAARRYLERRFQNYQITIYWGSVENFMQELNEQW